MFSLTLMSTSCEKDELIVPEPDEITVTDLLGDWNFESLEFFNPYGVLIKSYTGGCTAELDANYNYGAISILNVTDSELRLLDICSGGNGYGDRYSLINKTINFSDGKFIFEITNANTFNGTVLKLKLKSSNIAIDAPIDGIYTLRHSN